MPAANQTGPRESRDQLLHVDSYQGKDAAVTMEILDCVIEALACLGFKKRIYFTSKNIVFTALVGCLCTLLPFVKI